MRLIILATFCLLIASCAMRFNPSQGSMPDREGAQLANALGGFK